MLIKSFFRNKVTKIYLIIITVLFSTVFILNSFVNYYNNKTDDIYSKCAKIFISSETDIYKGLLKVKLINNVERILGFLPDKSYDVFVETPYIMTDSKGNVLSTYILEEGYEHHIQWYDLFEGNFEYILVESDIDKDFKLADNEVMIGMHPILIDYYDEYPEPYLNKLVGFKYLNQSLEFKIVGLYNNQFSNLVISNNLYNKLINNNDLYIYQADVLSFRTDIIDNEIELLNDKSSTFNSSIRTECGLGWNTMTNYMDLIDLLTIISYIFILIFSIIIFIVCRNLINDLNKKIVLQRRLGYNKLQIKRNIIIQLILLIIVSIILASILSFLIINIINSIFNLKLVLYIYSDIFKVSLYVLLINILIIVLKKI